jgi:hypothetical protein
MQNKTFARNKVMGLLLERIIGVQALIFFTGFSIVLGIVYRTTPQVYCQKCDVAIQLIFGMNSINNKLGAIVRWFGMLLFPYTKDVDHFDCLSGWHDSMIYYVHYWESAMILSVAIPFIFMLIVGTRKKKNKE